MTNDAEALVRQKHTITRGYSPEEVPVRVSGVVVGLSLLVVLLAAIAMAIWLLWRGEGKPYLYETPRRQTAEIHGRGLYRYDTFFQDVGNTGTDLTLLLLGISLLLAFRSIDLQALRTHFSVHMPRRVPAGRGLASGLVSLAIWLIEPVSLLIQHEPPQHLDTYTTLFANVLDMATQSHGLPDSTAARAEIFLAPAIGLQTPQQVRSGVRFSMGEIMGQIVSFGMFAILAAVIVTHIMSNIPKKLLIRRISC